jgi:uncharacterized protein with HEPN domain
MLSDDVRMRLEDMVTSVERIQSYTAGVAFEEFRHDQMMIDAVIRNFIIIGEAATILPADLAVQHADLPLARMKAMRNLIVHRYWNTDLAIV